MERPNKRLRFEPLQIVDDKEDFIDMEHILLINAVEKELREMKRELEEQKRTNNSLYDFILSLLRSDTLYKFISQQEGGLKKDDEFLKNFVNNIIISKNELALLQQKCKEELK